MKSALLFLPLALVAACTDDTIIQRDQTQRSITVVGEGSVPGTPDLALLTFSVRQRGENAGNAFTATSRDMTAVIEALKEGGIEPRDLRTDSIALNPIYGRNDRGVTNRANVVAYEGYQALSVRLRDIASAGQIIDTAVEAGANELQSFQLTFDDPAALQEEARIAAVRDARGRAERMAAAAGAKLGEVITIGEDMGSQPRPFAMRSMAMDEARVESTSIEVGERDTTMRVSVTFALR